ncbi:MAG TPA: asparagine synthetase B, partial [Alcanivorax sp.]|nr:asparagine synthetase B [Alcanivorax sp.]
MCGITGIFQGVPSGHSLKPVLEQMADAIAHRGPDDSGVWEDPSVGLGLGHRRLSIVDLSPAGHQPMRSDCGRFVLAFNGEIYNHKALRKELEFCGGVSAGWNGHSDTETLLRAFTVWGIEKTLEMATGMFAIALWDREEQTLILARDRFGEKPLYYGLVGG